MRHIKKKVTEIRPVIYFQWNYFKFAVISLGLKGKEQSPVRAIRHWFLCLKHPLRGNSTYPYKRCKQVSEHLYYLMNNV